ncbi:accessory Sec system glycosyltransferase Asp1 [Loigolactobacillus coryniformis]|uniref:accessory Sec system glycosyltransferase Asp1 n=1 Tax=Loigolactobacillus coryniformis TaxID=1610 RepID=UPI00233FC94C|nr:accessory Sec system glycosyltransferase Asp1 [Loigolactobacillus coryniformis]MDC4186909.1 accessory Sec system glycosyltransferase Asp1 [Loigolactobacillus coryniformis]
MFYFVNQTVPKRLTGIESAQLKRIRMFKHHGVAAQLVTVAYDPTFAHNVVTYKLQPQDVNNMYDYLCAIRPQTPKSITIEQLKLPKLVHKKAAGHEIRYFNEQQQLLVKVILRADATVQQVNYYGKNKQAVRAEVYDVRGFKSSLILYDQNLHMVQRQFFDAAGQVRLVFFYRGGQQSQQVVRAIQYYQSNGRWRHFMNESELMRYFFDQLNQTTIDNIFIADRTARVGWALAQMQTKAFKLFHIHSVHVNRSDQPQSNDFNSNYRFAFKNLNLWNGMVASTRAQVADLRQKFPQTAVYRASVSIISKQVLQAPSVKLAQRTPFKLIAVARLNPEKRLDQVVRIFALIHAQLPQATLDIWGFIVDKKMTTALTKLITALDLTDAVTLRGYATDMTPIYDQAQGLLITSRYEGTALVIAEALAHGVPVLAYDFHYGPREFINSGENGYIVPVDDQSAAAKCALELLTDAAKWQTMSQAAYRLSARSSEDAIFKPWQTIAGAAQAYYHGGNA